MARLSLDPPSSLTYRVGTWYSRRRYGKTLEPGTAMAHHPRLLRGYALASQGFKAECAVRA